jgi:hypothetical protein
MGLSGVVGGAAISCWMRLLSMAPTFSPKVKRWILTGLPAYWGIGVPVAADCINWRRCAARSRHGGTGRGRGHAGKEGGDGEYGAVSGDISIPD